MKLKRRLELLELRLPRPQCLIDDPQNDEDWLRVYEQLGKQGCFAPVADFPEALAAYRQALARPHASWAERLSPRGAANRQEVDAAWMRLAGLLDRLVGPAPGKNTVVDDLREPKRSCTA